MPAKKNKGEPKNNDHEEPKTNDPLRQGLKLNRFNTLTSTIRLDEVSAYLAECLAQQMNTNRSRLLSELLEDCLHQFLGDSSRVTIALLEYYLVLRRAKVLKPVNCDELITKIRMSSNVKVRGLHVDME